MRPHLVWDWNGTLFDDQHLVIDGVERRACRGRSAPTDLATYQRLYTRPVQVFYERLFGRAIGRTSGSASTRPTTPGTARPSSTGRLAADATDALARAADAGASQSLLSMWRHDELRAPGRAPGIADRFARIDGLRGEGGGVKAPYLQAHLDRVIAANGGPPTEVLVVGDALDDAAAAADVGAACVLYDGGSHPRHELEATDSLTEAGARRLGVTRRPTSSAAGQALAHRSAGCGAGCLGRTM
jgi:phosphoglycolate phosphatase-like HAD superfamily hydrolase